MDPRDFIELAQDLLDGVEDGEGSQSSLRTVVNRAYLGALLFSANALTRFRASPYPRDHTYYEAVEKDLYETLGGRLRERLWSLRTWRTRADYELAEDVDASMSVDSVVLARELVEGIGEKLP